MAYTKYSLTPANNNAAPPDGAPEGMLPSAVNDTMRDMMAQIRDVGDGIRGGTYTMTAPVITGGSVSGATGSFSTLAASGVATFSAGTVSAPAITTTGDTNTGIYFPAADTIAFTEGGVEAMRIDSSGNCGIGTSSPYTTLNVNGAISTNTGYYIGKSVATAESFAALATRAAVDSGGAIVVRDGFGTYNAGGIEFYTGSNPTGSEKMRIDSSGNVGIGFVPVASTYRTLQLSFSGNGLIVPAANDMWLTSNANFNGGWTYGATGAATAYEQVNGNHVWFGAASGTAGAGITLLERMRIDSSGNLLVGTTTITGAGGFSLRPNNSVGSATLSLNRNSDASSSTAFLFQTAAATVGSITYSNTATAFNTSSDYRLKENIAPMMGALARVSALKPVTYSWKVDGSASEGFIAHELAEVVPECVTGEKDAVDAEGKPIYQGIDTSFLVATLTCAIQELKKELDSVKAELQTLKGN